MAGDKRYVYGVTEAEPLSLEVDGVGGATSVETVEHRTLAAVVSDVDTLDPERTDENASAHDEVLRTVMTHGDGRTVVPMQFGMVFENDRTLKNVLRNGRRAFTKALREVDDMVELGVKVVAPGADGDDGAGASAPGATNAAAVEETAEAELDPLAVRVSEGERFSDRLLLNRSYLVERSDRDAFDDAVDRLRDVHEDVTVRYTGPWAPYSFVDIEIGVEQ